MSIRILLGFMIIAFLTEGYYTDDYDDYTTMFTPSSSAEDNGSASLFELGAGFIFICCICCLMLVAYKKRAPLLKCASQYLSSFLRAMQTNGNPSFTTPSQQTAPQQQQQAQHQQNTQQLHNGRQRHRHNWKHRQNNRYQQLHQQQLQPLQQQQQHQQQLQYPQPPIPQAQQHPLQQMQLPQQQLQQQQQPQMQNQQQHHHQQHNIQQYQPPLHNHQQQYPSNSGTVAGLNTSALAQPQNVAVSLSQTGRHKLNSPNMRPLTRTILAGSDEC